ncbi:MAG: hypothetical protein ACXVDD_00280 [Polyangia bacterium]
MSGADLATATPDLGVSVPDLAVGAPDLAMKPADLAMKPHDLAVPPDLLPGPDMARQMACAPAGGALRAQYVWNAVRVPMRRTDYALDLNGDGRADNQFGNIYGALEGQNLGVQNDATQAVNSGQSLTLIDAYADDFSADACAASDVEAADPMASPDFSGAGHFTVDAAAVPGHFAGTFAAGTFSSLPLPASAATPVIMTLKLPLLGAIIGVPLVGAHAQYTRAADGTVTGGQLNGAIRNSDVQNILVPALAASLTAQVQVTPLSSRAMELLFLFDNGGKADPTCVAGTCKNPDGTCAVEADQKIDVCEVATSGLLQNVLAPDVQMFDANGNYQPSPDNTHKDSLSIGLGFSAVPATF